MKSLRNIGLGALIGLFLSVVAGLLAYACAPTNPSIEQATDDITNMRFVRHPNGLCFGVVRFQSYGGYQGASITHVPSEACGDAPK